jgi:hypothetical protein
MEPTDADRATWPPPNFTNPDSRGLLIIGIEVPITFLAIIVVALRFYARTCIKKVLGGDDWMMLAAMVSISSSLLREPNNIVLMHRIGSRSHHHSHTLCVNNVCYRPSPLGHSEGMASPFE